MVRLAFTNAPRVSLLSCEGSTPFTWNFEQHHELESKTSWSRQTTEESEDLSLSHWVFTTSAPMRSHSIDGHAVSASKSKAAQISEDLTCWSRQTTADSDDSEHWVFNANAQVSTSCSTSNLSSMCPRLVGTPDFVATPGRRRDDCEIRHSRLKVRAKTLLDMSDHLIKSHQHPELEHQASWSRQTTDDPEDLSQSQKTTDDLEDLSRSRQITTDSEGLSLSRQTTDDLEDLSHWVFSEGLTCWSRQTSADTDESEHWVFTSCCNAKVSPKWHRRNDGELPYSRPKVKAKDLPDMTLHLIKSGSYEKYKRQCKRTRASHEGSGKRRSSVAMSDSPSRAVRSWRDGYRNWRAGGVRGARGEIVFHEQTGCTSAQVSELPPVVYDVVANMGTEPALVPTDGPETSPILVRDFPPEARLTIRVFRFFEDRSDEKQPWERDLLNVNSGSIFWLPWHLAPNMHSKAGAKYGTWFTIHYLQVYAKHFASAYHMCNEGYCGAAKSFGSTKANSRTITGESKSEGYFWYVSPADGKNDLRNGGWQHLGRAGPFGGGQFLDAWQDHDCPMQLQTLQHVLDKFLARAAQTDN